MARKVFDENRQLLNRVADHFQKEIALRGEVAVQRSGGHVGEFGDLGKGGIMEALLQEQLHGGIEDASLRFRAARVFAFFHAGPLYACCLALPQTIPLKIQI